MLVWVLVGVSLADLSGFPWKQTLRQGVDFSRFIEKWESETGKGREVKLRKKKKRKLIDEFVCGKIRSPYCGQLGLNPNGYCGRPYTVRLRVTLTEGTGS